MSNIYICLECGRVFNRPTKIRETHSELPEHLIEISHVCPFCNSQDFEEAETCTECGTYIGKEQARFHLCPDCETDAEQRFEKFLSENFTQNELAYLNNQYDGECFGL